ncbi:hypothetical protein BDZ89DRAFT_304381 [Hymenopellis radicata]|nr:hypothetical protein BDZ89DRAFT_304381 [Hymenopellis radicata]
MTRLHKLDLAVGGTHPRITVPIPLPELLELHLTELRQAGPTHMNDIFGALEIQSLAYLSITFPDELIDRSMHFPPSHNALGNLTKLRISGNPVGHSGNIQRLLAFLCLTPNVVELRLELMELGEELIDGLDFTKTPRLPRLCVLDVSECTIGYIVEDFHGFWDMLESRTLRQTAEELTGAGGNADGRCLEKVCVPRWVYIHALDLRESNRGALDVECGFALDDDDDDSTESDDSTDSDAAV